MKHIYIFDVDDTLIDTKACIRAIDDKGSVVFKAGTKVFNAPDSTDRLLSPGLKWDFTEFESLEQLMKEKIREPFEQLKVLANDNIVYVITARQCNQALLNWMKWNGVNTDNVQIRCFDHDYPTVYQWKAHVLGDIIERDKAFDGDTLVHIWEDDSYNKKAMMATCQKKGVMGVIEPI